MRFETYAVNEETVRKARSVGVYGNTVARLSRMARRSAPITSAFGNRRYQSFVMQVEGDLIKDVTRVDFSKN